MQWRYFYKGKINQCLISKSFLPDGWRHVSLPHCAFFGCTLAPYLTCFLKMLACRGTMVHGISSEFGTLVFQGWFADAMLLLNIKSSLHRKTCQRRRCQLICCISHMIYLRPYTKLNCAYRPHAADPHTRFFGAFTPCQYISILTPLGYKGLPQRIYFTCEGTLMLWRCRTLTYKSFIIHSGFTLHWMEGMGWKKEMKSLFS